VGKARKPSEKREVIIGPKKKRGGTEVLMKRKDRLRKLSKTVDRGKGFPTKGEASTNEKGKPTSSETQPSKNGKSTKHKKEDKRMLKGKNHVHRQLQKSKRKKSVTTEKKSMSPLEP